MSSGKPASPAGHVGAANSSRASALRSRIVRTRDWVRSLRTSSASGIGRLAKDAMDVTSEGEWVVGEAEQRTLEGALRDFDGRRLAEAGRELFEMGRQVFELTQDRQHPVGAWLTRIGRGALDRAGTQLQHARHRQQDVTDFHAQGEATPLVAPAAARRRAPPANAAPEPTTAPGVRIPPMGSPFGRRGGGDLGEA